MLNAVARRLETCLRAREAHPTLRNNDLVARLEGDQFVILLDGLKELGHAMVAAERILAEVLAPYRIGTREMRVSASLGIALSATAYERADDALRDADTALHRAKLLGGNRCEVFDTAALRSVQAELQLESDLRGAIERDEFVLFYQPIVSLSSNQILGFEALVRWQHPVLGLIPPTEFVPIAEKTGFIVPLGNWVLREACRQLKVWQNELPSPRDLWVSVNLSSAQLGHPGLVDDIDAALRDAALEPRCLILELTESLAMENPAAVQTLLMQLRARGIRISVDDFGTGHSALAYLRQLPLDVLKVDRSFVRGIEANTDMKSILAAVTAMTRELGLQLVAEGVEKNEQLELLRSLDCDSGQGYLFSKPVDGQTAGALLTADRPEPTSQPAPATNRAEQSRQPRTISKVLATAAVLAVVASVGLPRFFGDQAVPQLPTAPQPVQPPDIAQAIPQPPPTNEINASPAIPIDAPAPVRVPSVVSPPPAAAAVRGNAGRTSSPPTTTASTVQTELVPVVPAVPAARLAGAVPGTPSATPVTSVHVVHQHRLGSCRGQLVVSPVGVSYVPGDPGEAKDAFNLGHNQFLHELDGDSLTIRSTEKAYRFKVAEATGVTGDHLGPIGGEHHALRKVAPPAKLACDGGRRPLLATTRVLARPQRREVAAADTFGLRPQRRDGGGGERELGRGSRDRPQLAHQPVDDTPRRPAGEDVGQRRDSRGFALERGTMECARRDLGAQQVRRADLHPGRAKRHRSGNTSGIRDSAGGDDGHTHCLHDLRHQGEGAHLCAEIGRQEQTAMAPGFDALGDRRRPRRVPRASVPRRPWLRRR